MFKHLIHIILPNQKDRIFSQINQIQIILNKHHQKFINLEKTLLFISLHSFLTNVLFHHIYPLGIYNKKQ